MKADELGYRSLGNAADFLRTVLSGLATSDARIKTNPAQIKRTIRASLRGMDFARDPANQEKIIPYIMEDFQLDRKTAEASLREIVKHYSKDGMTSDERCAPISRSSASKTKSRPRYETAGFGLQLAKRSVSGAEKVIEAHSASNTAAPRSS